MASRPSWSHSTRSQKRWTEARSWLTRTIVRRRRFNSAKTSKHFCWKRASPTARTSSSRRMSASARSAVAKARRMSIPDERLFNFASRKRSSSANATASSTRAHGIRRIAEHRAVEGDVLGDRELVVEAETELEQRGDRAAHQHLADIGHEQPGRQAEGDVAQCRQLFEPGRAKAREDALEQRGVPLVRIAVRLGDAAYLDGRVGH